MSIREGTFYTMDEGTLKTPIPYCRLYWLFLFGVMKQFCRFWIWSETECKTAEYGPQYISPPPPPQKSHTVCIYCTLGRGGGGGGRREERRYSRGATVHKYSSFIHWGNSSQAGSKIQTMSECISSLKICLNRMLQSLLTGQLKEKPTYRVWCLYSSFVHALHTLLIHEKHL